MVLSKQLQEIEEKKNAAMTTNSMTTTSSGTNSSLKVFPDEPTSSLKASVSSHDSFDSIDYPLKVVKECMQRLEMMQKQEAAAAAESEAVKERELLKKSLRLDQLKSVYDRPVLSNGENQVGQKNGDNNHAEEVDLVKSIDFKQIRKDSQTVALEWDSFRSTKECSCGYLFDFNSRRNHCYSCGKIFCVRCTDRKIPLAGHHLGDNNLKEGGKESWKKEEDAKNAENHESPESDVFDSPDLNSQSLVTVCRSCYRTLQDKDS